MARSTLSQLASTHATAGSNQFGRPQFWWGPGGGAGEIETTFGAILQRGNLALERLHLHGQCPTQIPQLSEIFEFGLFRGDARRQRRRGLGGWLAEPSTGEHGGWS